MKRLDWIWIAIVWMVALAVVVVAFAGSFLTIKIEFWLEPIGVVVLLLFAWALFRTGWLASKARPGKSVGRLAPDGRLANDVTCIQCRCILRGLLPSGACPECGTPVDRSIAGTIPHHPPPRLTERDLARANPPVNEDIDSIMEQKLKQDAAHETD